MSVPLEVPPVPAAVSRLAGRDALRPVWRNERGGLTFEIQAHHRHQFVKWAPRGSGLDLPTEAAKLRWAQTYAPVPEVVLVDGDEQGDWLVTVALPGESAVAPGWRDRPRTAAAGIGRGLRQLHDALPVQHCPFDWSVGGRREQALSGDRAGPANWHPVHRDLCRADALALLADQPPVDLLVVCHGDACVPNTLLDPAGALTGHVDLGSLGTADRWADLAVATWSLDWNYGPGHEDALLDAYGVERDAARTAYYRLLWDLTP